MTYLSTHFTVGEFCRSTTAVREDIDNGLPIDLLPVARHTCYRLEEVRLLLGSNAISLSSGYRCEALERSICHKAYVSWCTARSIPLSDYSWSMYFSTKQHPKAESVDFTCSAFGGVDAIVRAIIASDIDYDQVISEFDGAWCHVSFKFDGPGRKQALIVDNKGQRVFV